jgi:hypothetical protein
MEQKLPALVLSCERTAKVGPGFTSRLWFAQRGKRRKDFFRMEITATILRAARRAEFDYYHQHRALRARFVPLPDPQLREILA